MYIIYFFYYYLLKNLLIFFFDTANATINNPLISLSIPRTKYNIGDFVDVEILSTSTADGLKIRVQRCWASPTSAGTTTYDLLLNRYVLIIMK